MLPKTKDNHFRLTERLWLPNKNWVFALFSAMLVLAQFSFAQDETTPSEEESSDTDDESVIDATVIEEVVTTGSRLQQNPGEIAGQVIVFDEEAIRASGEATLERVLRQLPQNQNPTTEKVGSRLNTALNLTGASTVNLRGLGSESTLILVDGKRIGYNGILGGVTDISSIPLSSVERIEIVMDGASAVYGSDAVGGVVNIITKKDYEAIELDIDYDRPSQGGYHETRTGISASQNVEGWQLKGTYQRSTHSGLDAADRDITVIQQSAFPGPRFDVRFCCLGDGSSLPIMYQLDGALITVPAYRALSPEDQARATVIHDAVLPEGFNGDSPLSSITELAPPQWGRATQEGRSVLPERTNHNYAFSVSKDINENLNVSAQVRGGMREVVTYSGYQSLSGITLGNRNPYNPFQSNVHVRGQLRDLPRPGFTTDSDILDMSVDLSGALTDQFDWEVSFGRSSDESTSLRVNPMDLATIVAGMRSDGVTPGSRFLSGETRESCTEKGGTFSFGLCRISVPAPPAINPWGDLSSYLGDALRATGENTHSRFNALIRGELFELPGGTARALLGYSQDSVALNSSTEFQIGVVDASPIGDVENFSTETERKNSAFFFEAAAPLVNEGQGISGIHSLNLSFSWRRDDYDSPSVTYIDSVDGNVSPDDLAAPGAQDSWGVGLVYAPIEDFRFKLNYQSAFVAPQLNQLLRTTQRGPSAPFRGIWLQQPDGNLRAIEVIVIEGGNPDLKPETADTFSAAFEYSPPIMPNLLLKATYSDVEYKDRINQLSFFIIDPTNLPTNTYVIPGTGDDENIYVQERRWINVSSVVRQGMDFELIYGSLTDWGDMNVHLKRSVTNTYEYVIDPSVEDDDANAPISVVGRTEGSTIIGVLPRASMNGTFSWNHRGVGASIDYQTRSKTVRASGNVTNIYTPLSQTDLTFSYHMVDGAWFGYPQFLEGARLTFYVNNVQDKLGKTEIFSDETGEVLEQSGPDSSPIYGRFIGLSLKVPLRSPF